MLDVKLASKQEAERKRLQAFVDRFRAKATKARQAQSRVKLLAKLEPVAAVIADEVRPIEIPPPAKPLSPPIIALDDVAVGYEPGRPVLRRLTLRIDDDDRIALLGANGNGKSTLVKLIAGRLAPMSGQVTRPQRLEVGYFAQHQLDELRRRRERLRPSAPADARRAGGQGARARRSRRLSAGARRHAVGAALGRRESAAAARACDVRRAASPRCSTSRPTISTSTAAPR